MRAGAATRGTFRTCELGSQPPTSPISSAPARDAVFAGAGITAQFGERWNATLYYNADFGRQSYISHSVNMGLNFKF
jgi:outer membrane autotransporter protein